MTYDPTTAPPIDLDAIPDQTPEELAAAVARIKPGDYVRAFYGQSNFSLAEGPPLETTARRLLVAATAADVLDGAA
jgi:hypothetical protein